MNGVRCPYSIATQLKSTRLDTLSKLALENAGGD